MKNFTITFSLFCLCTFIANAQLIKNDFLSGYSLGEGLETATYTSLAEASETLQDEWMAKFGNSGGSNSKIIAPLTYTGYAESGIDFAFEVEKASSGSRTFGYSLTDENIYNSGSYYLALMININENLGVSSTDRTRNMIGFNTLFTLDVTRVVLSVTKGGAEDGKFRFGIGERHSTAKGTYPMQWSSDSYTFNQTYLAVLKYDFSTQKASLFINPIISETEPTPLVEITITESAATSIADRGIRAICLEQSNVESRKIGGLRFAKSWAAAVGFDTPTSIENQTANKGIVVCEKYFSMDGMYLTFPTKEGIYIKKTDYSDGSAEISKFYFKSN